MPHFPEALWWSFSCSRSCTSRLSSFYISYSRGHICLTFVFSMMFYGRSQPPKSIYQTRRCLMPQWGNILLKVAESCLTHCNPMEYSSPTSSVRGVLQAGILKWVAIPLSKGSSRPRVEPECPTLQADSLPSEPPVKPQHILSGGYFQTWIPNPWK